MSKASIMFRTSAQPIAQDDVRQLREAILAAVRGEVGAILDEVKQGKAPSGSARARAVAQAVRALPDRTREGMFSARGELVGKAVAVPKRVTPLAALAGARPVAQAAASGPPASKLSLRVSKIRCVSDTKELGKDEILLGAQATMISLSNDGTFGAAIDAGTTAPIALGKFKTGDQKDLELVVASFNLRDGQPFPRVFNGSLLLVEHDFGDPGKLITVLKAVEALVEDKVVEKVEEFLKDALADEKFAPLIALAVTLVPSVLAALIGAIGKAFADEQFPLFAAAVAMDSPTDLFEGGKRDTADQVATFSAFGGTYQVTFDFALG